MVEHDGRWWLAYHAWQPGAVGAEPGRQFWIDELTWSDGRPVVILGTSPKSQVI